MRRIVRAVERREREVVMMPRASLALVLKVLAPSLIDRMASKALRTKKEP